MRRDGFDNLKHNLSGTASLAAGGTGAVLNFASQNMRAIPLTEEEYRELEAHRMKVINEQETMTVMSRLHENALLVQEQRRLSEEAEKTNSACSSGFNISK